VSTYTNLNPIMRLNLIRHEREMCIPIIPFLFILFYFILFYFIFVLLFVFLGLYSFLWVVISYINYS